MEKLIKILEKDTLYGGLEVLLAKEKKHGSTLSTAYAVFRYFDSFVCGGTPYSYILLMIASSDLQNEHVAL